jgi:hypothetical protein
MGLNETLKWTEIGKNWPVPAERRSWGVPVGQIQSIWYRRKAKKLSYKMHKVNCKNKLVYLLVDRRIGQAKGQIWVLVSNNQGKSLSMSLAVASNS